MPPTSLATPSGWRTACSRYLEAACMLLRRPACAPSPNPSTWSVRRSGSPSCTPRRAPSSPTSPQTAPLHPTSPSYLGAMIARGNMTQGGAMALEEFARRTVSAVLRPKPPRYTSVGMGAGMFAVLPWLPRAGWFFWLLWRRLGGEPRLDAACIAHGPDGAVSSGAELVSLGWETYVLLHRSLSSNAFGRRGADE